MSTDRAPRPRRHGLRRRTLMRVTGLSFLTGLLSRSAWARGRHDRERRRDSADGRDRHAGADAADTADADAGARPIWIGHR
ncbi:hypothetical protein [Haliangium sp.]|uniref:hypothetical protein n=1 Tax=Haliangium sp. TaxID=2663208 RepID=UPI003D0F4DC3